MSSDGVHALEELMLGNEKERNLWKYRSAGRIFKAFSNALYLTALS
jgi:hypothetical protein